MSIGDDRDVIRGLLDELDARADVGELLRQLESDAAKLLRELDAATRAGEFLDFPDTA